MKYLRLAYGDERRYAAMTKAELEELGAPRGPGNRDLRPGGHLALVASLAPTRSATTLRPLNGKTVLCDGPYAESREQVGGFFILEAKDFDYHLTHSARADLLRRLGRTTEAAAAYRLALGLARQDPERRFLERRLSELEPESRRSPDEIPGARLLS